MSRAADRAFRATRSFSDWHWFEIGIPVLAIFVAGALPFRVLVEEHPSESQSFKQLLVHGYAGSEFVLFCGLLIVGVSARLKDSFDEGTHTFNDLTIVEQDSARARLLGVLCLVAYALLRLLDSGSLNTRFICAVIALVLPICAISYAWRLMYQHRISDAVQWALEQLRTAGALGERHGA